MKTAPERRTELRARLSQRVRVQILDTGCVSEICNTRDVSKHGLYFLTSSNHYSPGMKVAVIRNFDPDDQLDTSESGEVVRVDKLSESKKGVAIRILNRVQHL